MAQSTIDLAASAAQLRKPGEGLSAVAALRGQLDTLEAIHVDNALREGWSWTRISRSLGVSRQAAHKKHAKRVRTTDEGQSAAAAPGRVIVTAQARRAVRFAREEARLLRQEEVRSTHLLLGLLREGHGPAARALVSSGVSLDGLRSAVGERERLWSVVDTAALPEQLPISPAARSLLEQSLREAVRLRDGHLGAEHMLLALLREDEVTREVLSGLAAPAERVERRLSRILEEPAVVFQGASAGAG